MYVYMYCICAVVSKVWFTTLFCYVPGLCVALFCCVLFSDPIICLPRIALSCLYMLCLAFASFGSTFGAYATYNTHKQSKPTCKSVRTTGVVQNPNKPKQSDTQRKQNKTTHNNSKHIRTTQHTAINPHCKENTKIPQADHTYAKQHRTKTNHKRNINEHTRNTTQRNAR